MPRSARSSASSGACSASTASPSTSSDEHLRGMSTSAQDADEREEFRRSVRAFVDREVLPKAEDLDRHGVFPHGLFARLGELDYLSLRYPEEVGGQGADFATACVLYEELAAGSLSLAAICAMQGLMGTHFVFRFGTPEQHEKYLRPALRGEKVATFALTEPGAGSDLGAMRTRAR